MIYILMETSLLIEGSFNDALNQKLEEGYVIASNILLTEFSIKVILQKLKC